MTKKPQRDDFRAAQAGTEFSAALRAHQAGRLQEAEQHYRQALAADPKHIDALHLFGVLAHQAGRSDVAIDLIGKALALDERVPDFHYNIGLAYGALGRLEEAAAHNRKAIAFRPDYAEAHMNLGNAIAGQGKHAEAVQVYKRALALRPGLPEGYYNLANTLAALGQPDEAVTHYERALALRPDYAEAHNNLGTVLMAQGQVAQAAERHRRAIALRPGLATAHLNLGVALSAQGKRDEAVDCYRQALAHDPNHAEAHNNLGGALLAHGALSQASACFERALALKPGLAQASLNFARALVGLGDLERALRIARDVHERHETADTQAVFFLCLRDPRSIPCAADYRDDLIRAITEPWGSPRPLAVVATSLIKRNPAIAECVARVEAAWPTVLTGDALFGASGVAPIAEDRLLRTLLESVQSFDVALEWFLTAVRATLLQQAAQPDARAADEQSLAFHGALTRQCFINEYVFACSQDEVDDVARLRERLSAELASGAPVPALWVVALAAYVPLHTLPFADALLARDWPDAVRAVLVQQVSEPAEEIGHRAAMPRLTRIEDASSQAVRAQYEVNPYPRWTKVAPIGTPKTVDHYLRERFPLAPFRPLGKPKLDYLIAGCGAGEQVASVAQAFSDAAITAIDLSLTSLSYARRQIAKMGLTDIAFGQADILELASLGRTFDVIDAAGVLHHIADGDAAWRVLLSILRPGGIMRVALYSTVARRDIAAARRYIASKGYAGGAADIRQCRQDIMAMPADEPIRRVTTIIDFFSISDCRDLLFHVEEHTWTIPQLATFFVENNLEFLGFEVEFGTMRRYAERFPDDPAQTNLAHWRAFEQDNPDTFIGMYQFWLQKPGGAPAH